MKIQKGTTHIWTPAYYRPYVGAGITRRCFYRWKDKKWMVWSEAWKDWIPSTNTPEWFAEEKKLGYFVTVKRFNDPMFTPKKEVV